jgi:hypothetical protein
MSGNLIKFKSKNNSLDLDQLTKLLNSLLEKERLMTNPLLKDWFSIQNQIRKVRRTIKEVQYGQNGT